MKVLFDTAGCPVIEGAVITPINKGWSLDKKYRIETAQGERLLLRIADIAERNRKKAEYSMMERAYAIGVPAPKPLEFELCENGNCCYSLVSWLPGEDAATALPHMSEAEQYALGIKAGEALHKIHTLPAPEDAEPWGDWFYRKVQGRMDFYKLEPEYPSSM